LKSLGARLGRNLTQQESARYLGDPSDTKTCIELNPAAAAVQ